MGRRRKDSVMEPMRRCHDCGALTRDYRCPACRKAHMDKWRESQGLLPGRQSGEYDPDSYHLNLEETWQPI